MNKRTYSRIPFVIVFVSLIFLMLPILLSCDNCLIVRTQISHKILNLEQIDVSSIRDSFGKNFIQLIFNSDEYTINADSLKLIANVDNYHVNYIVIKSKDAYTYKKEWPEVTSIISNNYKVNHDTIYIRFKAHPIFIKDRIKDFEKSPIYHILPSNFILRNGKPIITDTITFQICKCPIIHINML